MGITERIMPLFPPYKWCGCKSVHGDTSEYQFRVKAQTENDGENLFQIREKRICTECEDEKVDVLVESECSYDPEGGIHERKVGVDEEDMVQYGFQPEDEMARMLIEMRLSDSLEPNISSD